MSVLTLVPVIERTPSGAGGSANRGALTTSSQCADRGAARRADAHAFGGSHVTFMTEGPGLYAGIPCIPVVDRSEARWRATEQQANQ
jgi:hypothetical protein